MFTNTYFRLILSLLLLLCNVNDNKANIVVTNGLTHQLKTEKDQTYHGSIQIQNIGKERKNVKIYIQDVTYNSDGTTIYSEPGTIKLSNAKWIELNSNLIDLQPGEETEVKYEIKVPEHINEPGSYSSILMIEPVEAIPQISSNKAAIQILSVIRYAVHIITDYAIQNAEVDLKFESININNNADNRTIQIALQNKGNVFCKTIIQLEIYSIEDGTKIEGNFNSQTNGLLPNTSRLFTIDVSSLPQGKYKAIAFARDQVENIFALEFEVDIE